MNILIIELFNHTVKRITPRSAELVRYTNDISDLVLLKTGEHYDACVIKTFYENDNKNRTRISDPHADLSEVIPGQTGLNLIYYTGIVDAIEYMSIELSMKSRKWNIIYIYKPPKVLAKTFCDFMHSLCETFVADDKLCIFMGDMNCNMLVKNELTDICDIYGLINLIKTPLVLNPAMAQLLMSSWQISHVVSPTLLISIWV